MPDIRLPLDNKLEDPAPYPDDDTSRPEEYAQYTRALWDEQEDALWPIHQVWMQNLLFLAGRQWWRPNPISGLWAPMNVPEWREQPVANLTLSFYKTFLAKATKVRPRWTVIPASLDPKDIEATELADEVLDAKWMELRLGKTLRRAIIWAITTGNVYLYPYWNTSTGKIKPLTIEVEVPKFDPETGAQMTDPETGEPMTELMEAPVGEDGEPILLADGTPDPEAQPLMIDEGDVGVRVYSPFQVRVNPDAEDDTDLTWVVIAETRLVRDLKQEYPEHAHYIKAEEVGRMEDYDKLISAVAGGSDTAHTTPLGNTSDELQKAMVFHYHEKPTPEYPEGRYWISCGDDCLLEGPSELPEGLWPAVIHLKDVEIPGRFLGASTMESIVGLNREYNEINAQVKEHHNLMSKGKWLVPKGSGIRKGMITSQPGEVIQHNPGFEPKQADIKPLPAAVYQERERVQSDFQAVGGIHRVSQGAPPKGVTAGVAILQLQEADDADLGPFLAHLEEAVAQLAHAILNIIRDNYTSERLVHVAGPNRKYLVRSFRGSDLEGVLDVQPVSESAFPWSKAARQQMLTDMAMKIPQIFMDPDTGQFDVDAFRSALPLGGLESIAPSADLDVAEAKREQEMFEVYLIESNELPEVGFWQDHKVHLREHYKVLKSSAFKEWSPEVQQRFIQHVQMHQQEVQMQMDKMMQRQNAAKNGGDPNQQGPAGAPGQPPAGPPALTEQIASDLDPGLM